MSDHAPGRSLVYKAADPRSACHRAGSSKFPQLSEFSLAKRVLSTRSSKRPEFYPIKTCFKKKKRGYNCLKKKERQCQPAPPSQKRKKKESILIFAGFFFVFLAPPARCGTKVRNTHGSEVNIYRFMTRNESAVFKEEPTLAYFKTSHPVFI